MCGIATFAIDVSRASMKVAMVTVRAITHGLARGFQVSWNESVAAAAKRGCLHSFLGLVLPEAQLRRSHARGSSKVGSEGALNRVTDEA